MNKVTHVLTIYQNLDYRDQRRFYGRNAQEVGNILIDLLVADIEHINRGGDYEDVPVHCFLTPDHKWIELMPEHARDGGSIYQTAPGEEPIKLYRADIDIELAAVFFSHCLTLGQWEELPIAPEELPAWIVNDPRHIVPKRVNEVLETAVTKPQIEPEQLANDLALEAWPYMVNLPPNAYKDAQEGRGPSYIYKHDISLLIYPPHGRIWEGSDSYIALSYNNLVAGSGTSQKMAIYVALKGMIDYYNDRLNDGRPDPEYSRQRIANAKAWLAELETYPVENTAEKLAEALAKAANGD